MSSIPQGFGAAAERLFARIDRAAGTGRAWPLALFAAALILKIVYVLQSNGELHLRVPLGDARLHVAAAAGIRAGELAPQDAFLVPPLYTYFLALARAFGEHSLAAARILQAAGGAATVLLAFLIGRRVFRPAAALCGALLLVLLGAATWHEGEISGAWMGAAWAMLSLWLLSGGRGPDSVARTAGAGVALGLSALAGAHVLVFAPLAVWWIARGARGRRTAAAGFAAGLVAALLPVWLHNAAVGKTWLPVSTGAGVNFYIGNGGDATGAFAPVSDFADDPSTHAFVERQTGEDMRAGGIASYWFARARDDMAREPARLAKLAAAKLAMCFNGYEAPRIDGFDGARAGGVMRALFVRMWFVAPLALAGMFLARRTRAQGLLLAFVLGGAAALAAFFVSGIDRAPLVPVLCLFAGHALVSLPARLTSPRAAAAHAFVALALAAATAPAIFAPAADEAAFRAHVQRARRLAELGSRAPALRESAAAIALRPRSVDGYLQRALVHARGGDDFKAMEDYRRALELDDTRPVVHYELAQALRRVNLRERAVAEYRRAIELDPGMAQAHNNLGIALREMGRLDEAIAVFKTTIELAPKYRRAYNNLGASWAEAGRIDEAIAVFEETVRRFPDYPNGYKNLAMAHASQRRPRPALEAMRRYAALSPADPDAAEMVRKLEIAVRADSAGAGN